MSGCPADPRPAPGSVRFLWISHQCVVFRASWGSCHARLSLPAGSRGAPVGVPAGRSERLPGGAHPTLQAALALPLTSARCPSARACQAELSARVRRDESLREAPLSPGLPAAGKKGGVLAVGRADKGGPPPRPGFTTDLGVLVMWMPPPPPRTAHPCLHGLSRRAAAASTVEDATAQQAGPCTLSPGAGPLLAVSTLLHKWAENTLTHCGDVWL